MDRLSAVLLETARLRLRPLTADDAEFVLELVNDPAFIANIADKGIRTVEAAQVFLREGPWTCQSKPGHGLLRVARKDDDRAVGVCGLLFREKLGETDVGFAFLAAHRGQGFAFEAARAVVDYGLEELHAGPIVGLTLPANVASVRVLEKLGMQFDRFVTLYDEGSAAALYR